MNSGKRLSRCCRNPRGAGDRGRRIAASSKASCGCLRPERAGAICRRNIPAPALAGAGCSYGKPKACGSRCGASSWPNWTRADNWTGVRALWTGVSLPLKRGRVRRQNQARQGHKVDGCGRRPRCSSGKALGLGLKGVSPADSTVFGLTRCGRKRGSSYDRLIGRGDLQEVSTGATALFQPVGQRVMYLSKHHPGNRR